MVKNKVSASILPNKATAGVIKPTTATLKHPPINKHHFKRWFIFSIFLLFLCLVITLAHLETFTFTLFLENYCNANSILPISFGLKEYNHKILTHNKELLGELEEPMLLQSIMDYLFSTLSIALVEPTHSPIAIHDMSAHFIHSLRSLNLVLLPVHYSDRLYRDVLSVPRMGKMASYNLLPIGAITSRLEAFYESDLDTPLFNYKAYRDKLLAESRKSDAYFLPSETHLYIMTLGVLAPYRRLGIGKKLIDSLIIEANRLNQESQLRRQNERSKSNDPLQLEDSNYIITALTLHVQFGNTAGMAFYTSQGFKELRFIEHYYSNIKPRGASVMYLPIPFEEYLSDL